MTIYISNLNYVVRDNELNDLFSEFGLVTSAKVIMDKYTGKSRGFGFVEMPSDEEANTAINKLNQSEHQGKTLSVSEARPKEERPRRDFNKRY
ncbi:MAG: RNA recognition motif domain-containing protein [Chitinophagaceae bacterium]